MLSNKILKSSLNPIQFLFINAQSLFDAPELKYLFPYKYKTRNCLYNNASLELVVLIAMNIICICFFTKISIPNNVLTHVRPFGYTCSREEGTHSSRKDYLVTHVVSGVNRLIIYALPSHLLRSTFVDCW